MQPRSNTSFRSILARLVLVLVPMAGLAGCDVFTDSEEPLTVQGTWVGTDGEYTIYLRITSATVTVYDGIPGECFYIQAFNIASQQGDEYTLGVPETTFTFTIIFRVENGRLMVREADAPESEAEYFDPSDQDLAQLEECEFEEGGGGGDPSITCTSLPGIDVGQTIDGELTTDDDSFSGRYFDLYGLNLDASQQVRIDLMSDDIDTYLYVYESDGTYIDENDDVGEGFNSSLTLTLGPGCFRIEATSWDTGETGPYSVSVN